ncbi:MAG: NFACT family protein [Defluviitaleaceae bacterium]|nr:NFACT family protein [Defluviitaleaceae bacterium]
MPQDGTTLNSVMQEISGQILGGRVDKITQPEPDEIVISVRGRGANHKLLLTTQSTAPRLHFTSLHKQSPMQAPMFCMVLRKHISGGRIVDIRQPDFERIIEFHIEALDEMGDKSVKVLVIEIMGKHSNIMLLTGAYKQAASEADNQPEAQQSDDKAEADLSRIPMPTAKVIDAIKHVPPSVSSVRAILPGVRYNRPPAGGKANPLIADEPSFLQTVFNGNIKIQQALYQRYTGLSPVLASEICTRADIAADSFVAELAPEEQQRLYQVFSDIFRKVKSGDFAPHIYYDSQGKAVDITVLPFTMYTHLQAEAYVSTSQMQEDFYAKRDAHYRTGQRTADLRKLITTHLERSRKKALIYDKTLADTQSRDELRIKGELLTAYLHQVKNGEKSVILENFYDDNKPIEVPLSPTLTPTENAQRYFKQYNKMKRTHIALAEQIRQNDEDIAYLDSVAVAMEAVLTEADIAEIRAELAGQGFVKRKYAHKPGKKAQKPEKTKPLRFVSTDGFEIYVGKNNTQNDQLTIQTAKHHDIWLHTKDIAGSHVIIITNGAEPPETTILEAANLAAYYSKGRESSKVPVDYTKRRYVRKPNGAKPGRVIYDRHSTVYVTPAEP